MRARISQRPSHGLAAIALTVLLIAVEGCATQGTAALYQLSAKAKTASETCLQTPDFPGDLMAQYNASIVDSAVFLPCRQWDELRPVAGRTVMGSFISCFQCGASESNCSNKCLDSTGSRAT